MASQGEIGQWGEAIAVHWLQHHQWQIVAQRWRIRGGEIDAIAVKNQQLIFLEVKTRGGNHWDWGGALAVDGKKQRYLTRTATHFLGENPQYGEYFCRFDVILVTHEPWPMAKPTAGDRPLSTIVATPSPWIWQGHRWRIRDYIEGAFEAVAVE